MRDNSLLDTILEPDGLSVMFQPVMEAQQEGTWHLYAVECLTRGPKGTNLESAAVLFEYARRKRAESLVDRASIAAALREAGALSGVPGFCLNVHASTLGRDGDFVNFLVDAADLHQVPLSRLTVEIIERAPYWNGPRFMSNLDFLRRLGIRISLDDFGLGESNFRMVLDCWPDHLKIDRYLVKGCSFDDRRRAILESVAQLAGTLGARVVAEGVEDLADLEAINDIGITLVQGYVFSRPMSSMELMMSGVVGDSLVSRAQPVYDGEVASAGPM